MKRPPQDEVQRLRDQLRLRIDTATKSVAEVLQVAADLMLATARQKANSEPGMTRVEGGHTAELLTARAAATYLGVAVGTLGVWRCRRSYPLPFVKVGKKVRYRKADLDDFLRRRTKGGWGEGDSP